MLKAILGVDISKNKMDAVLLLGDKSLKRIFANSPDGFGILVGWLKSLHIEQVHACLEATGPYSEPVAEFLHAQGHRVSMVNPLRIKGFAKSDLKRNKTDAADARTIADFCLAKDPELWHPVPVEIKRLRDLMRRIEVLEKLRASEKNRFESASGDVSSSLERMIARLDEEIDYVQSLVKEHIDNHPNLKIQSELLQSIPGIAEKTAQTLLSEINFSAYTSARSVAAHAGLTPRKNQSGTSFNRTKLSKVGSSRIRKALYFPAITAMRYNLFIKDLADRLDHNGKASKQVICAAMRKLLHIAFGVLKHNQPFNPNILITFDF